MNKDISSGGGYASGINTKFFLISVFILLVITIFTYSNTLNVYFFLGDDWWRLSRLAQYPKLFIRYRLLLDPEFINPALFISPLASLVWMLNYSLFNFNPLGYHIYILFFHFLNAVLVMFLFYSITSDPERPRYFSKRYFAFLAGILFSVHPIHTETVARLSAGIENITCTSFCLISILGFIFYLKRGKIKFFVLSLVAFIFALLTKELAITLPFVILSYAILFANSISLKKITKMFIPYLIILTVYWLCRYKILGGIGGYSGVYSQFDLKDVITTLTVRPYYWLVFPFNRLVFQNHSLIRVLLGTLVGISVAGATFNKKTWNKKMLFTILWIFLTTIPYINLLYVREDLLGSRMIYLQTVGFCVLVAHLISNISLKKRWTQILQTILMIAFISSYILITVKNNTAWNKAIEPVRKISEQIKSMHPEFPDGSRIYTPKLPYVHPYLCGIEYAILAHYNPRIYVFAEENYQGVHLKCMDLGKKDFVFFWNPTSKKMEDVSLKLKELLQKTPQSLPNWNFTKTDTNGWEFREEIISPELAITPLSVEQIEIKMKAPSIKSKMLGVGTLSWMTNKELGWDCFYPIIFSIDLDEEFHTYKISLFPCFLDTITRVKLSFYTFHPKEAEVEYIRFLPLKECREDEIPLLSPTNNAILSTPPTFEWTVKTFQSGTEPDLSGEENYVVELFSPLGLTMFCIHPPQNNKSVWPADAFGAWPWNFASPGAYYWRVTGEDSLTVRRSEIRCFIKK